VFNKVKPSQDAQYLSLLGKFAEANYKLGANENKGRPQPDDITKVERTRIALLEYADA
jgi:hypothetical protein